MILGLECSGEAVKTAIWLNEVAEKSNVGQHIGSLSP